MKIKGILAVVLAALISFGAGLGTLAFYQSTFTSSGDLVAEEWDVSAEEIIAGTTFEQTFSNLDLAPGRDEVYDFRIRRNTTDLNYIIKIDVEATGGLFDDQGGKQTPVLLTLGSNSETPIAVIPGVGYEFEMTNTGDPVDFFSLKVEWPWETADFIDPLTGSSFDNLWAEKEGNIEVTAVVMQEADWGELATMRVRMKPAEGAAYTAVAAHLNDVSGTIIDRTLTGRMVIDGNNVQFKADDADFGIVELNNKSLSFVTIGTNVNLGSVYNVGASAGTNDANITSVNTQTWLNFVE